MAFSGTASGGGSGATRADVGHAVLFAGAAALGGFLFGFDTAVINGAVGAIRDKYDIGASGTGLTVSLTLLGAALGAWIAGTLADRLGRIRVMQIAAVLFIIGAVGSAIPFSVYDLTFWRVVGGLAVGFASVIAPAYIAEISPAAIRGRLGSMTSWLSFSESPCRSWSTTPSRPRPVVIAIRSQASKPGSGC